MRVPSVTLPVLRTPLSPRQKEVVILIACGYASKHIARALGLAVKTVDMHRSLIASKFGTSHPAILTRYALHHGWITL